jgi:hypothetical protein
VKRLLLAAALSFLFGGPVLAGPPAIVDLSISQQGEDYLASGKLVDGLSVAMLEEIDAGIETTLDYRLQLLRRRSGLPDDVLARRLVECTVRHDALTRQYTLTRRMEGEMVETRVTADGGEMRAFLTTLRAVPVVRASELAPGEEYYLRARGELGLVWRFYLIPWRLNTEWARIDLIGPGKDERHDRP